MLLLPVLVALHDQPNLLPVIAFATEAFAGRPEWRLWQAAERRETFMVQAHENALFLLKWLALACILEALPVTYVPAELIAGLVGDEGIVPIGIAALVGMPAYLNSYVAPPMIAGLIDGGMSDGAAMSFIVPGAILSGILFQAVV